MASQILNETKPTRGHRLDSLFAPRAIAFVGATEKSPWARFIANNLNDFAFDGRAFAVNRSGSDVFGLKGFNTCTAIGEPVDVAFMMLPQSAVIAAIEDAHRAGIRNAVVLASGYGEVGPEGMVNQQTLMQRATELGINLWGPNSLGFNNVSARAPVSAIPTVLPLLDPRIAIVSQSGASASELSEFAHSQNIGTSFVAATGNEAQLSLADVVDYLVDHAQTRAIAIFAETIRDPAKFELAARRAEKSSKPIVVLKIGRSELAGKVAKAHTGSLAGNDSVFDSICDRLGVIRVFSPEDLIVTAGLLAATGPLPSAGVEFISISGGSCTLAADAAETAGVLLPPHSRKTRETLEAIMPGFGSTLNPLDVTGAAVAAPALFEQIIPAAASSPDTGLVAINLTVPVHEGQAGLPEGLAAIGRCVTTLGKPAVMVLTTTKSLTDVTRAAIEEHDLPHVVCGIDSFLRAAGKAAWWSGQLSKPDRPLGRSTNLAGRTLALESERDVLAFLSDNGVPVIPATIAQTRAEAEAERYQEPLVLKILSRDIAHKTDVGGVRLNVDPTTVGASFDEICAAVKAARPDARIDGVIISPMRVGGVELLVGITRDPTWGLTITIGFGGIFVELMADVAIAPLPVNPDEVCVLLGKLRGRKLLGGFRGAEAVDLDELAAVIARIGNAALALGDDLEALEINPLLVRGKTIEALDGLAVWKGKLA